MILWNDKDGGEQSRVWCWGFEFKRLFSVLLLKFDEGSREAFHTHAFNSVSLVLRGALHEVQMLAPPANDDGTTTAHKCVTLMHCIPHTPSWRPVFTYRDTFHMVEGRARATWVLTLRGPWADNWREFLPEGARHIRLTHGRRELR
jgi:hypothetical protein